MASSIRRAIKGVFRSFGQNCTVLTEANRTVMTATQRCGSRRESHGWSKARRKTGDRGRWAGSEATTSSPPTRIPSSPLLPSCVDPPLLRGSSTSDWILSSLWPLAAAAAFPTVSSHGGSTFLRSACSPQPAREPRLEQSEAADGQPRQVGGEGTDDFFPSHTHPVISPAPLLRGSSTDDWIPSSLWSLAASAAFPTVSGHGGSLHYFRWVDPAVAVAAAEGGSGGSRWWWRR
uniref:Uncharacterized protein n=1 Tax=Oryza rufipogon TaxID=4529 RepID=A0A0E0P451_ORYRU